MAKKGSQVYIGGKKTKLNRLIRMHADEMEEVDKISPGDIFATFGVDCYSGETFGEKTNLKMTRMFVPDPVMSMSVKLLDKSGKNNFAKALAKFVKEDPTLRCD